MFISDDAINGHDQRHDTVNPLTGLASVGLDWFDVAGRILLDVHAIRHPSQHRVTAMPDLF